MKNSHAQLENWNIAKALPEWAAKTPDKVAVSAPLSKNDRASQYVYQELTFKELEDKSNFLASQFLRDGLKPGEKVLMFVRPSVDFSAITFALFKAGLVPIFIDPGMGRENLLRAIDHIKPDALVAEPVVHFLALIFPSSFRSLRFRYTMGRFTLGQTKSIKKLSQTWAENIKNTTADAILHPCTKNTMAAILFTSGGTGIPKAVHYTHEIFNAQVTSLQELFNLTPEDVDLPGFPLFSLFTITMGMKSAIPAMNPSKPSSANPEALVKNIQDSQATFVAGSPAIWKNLVKYCLEKEITLPSVKYLVMFGAPVPNSLHKGFKKILVNGDTYTPYGATECLPVANISGTEVLNIDDDLTEVEKGSGFSTCVGRPVPGTVIKIAPITENIIDSDDHVDWLEIGDIGEVCVLSKTVTPEYIGMKQKTLEAKIKSTSGGLWHRMGDLGYLDKEGKLWFCGRKSHRLNLGDEVLPCIPQESIYNEFKEVQRCALVGPKVKGVVSPTLIVQPTLKLSKQEQDKLRQSIMSHDQNYKKVIEKVMFTKKLPVDVRHNIKIDRLKLKEDVEKGILS